MKKLYMYVDTGSIKEQRQFVRDHYAGIPEQQVRPGIYLYTVGYKYVHLLNIHEPTTVDKYYLSDYVAFLKGDKTWDEIEFSMNPYC